MAGSLEILFRDEFFKKFLYINMCIFEAISNFFLTDGFPLPFLLRFFLKNSPLIGRMRRKKGVAEQDQPGGNHSTSVMIGGYRSIYFIILYRAEGRFYFIY